MLLTPKVVWLPSNTERARGTFKAGFETIQSPLLVYPFLIGMVWAGDSRQGMAHGAEPLVQDRVQTRGTSASLLAVLSGFFSLVVSVMLKFTVGSP